MVRPRVGSSFFCFSIFFLELLMHKQIKEIIKNKPKSKEKGTSSQKLPNTGPKQNQGTNPSKFAPEQGFQTNCNEKLSLQS
jgi:hypothetical protein